MTARSLYLTGDPDADALLAADGNALLLGMTLDQQIPMEKAFAGPKVIADRMGGELSVPKIAATPVEEFAAMCAVPPAVHRFPGSMGGRVHQVCQALVADYDGDAENLWGSVDSGAQLRKRIAALPGFGEQKSKIFVALLGKQYQVTPSGWREAAGSYGDEGVFLSVADVVDQESLAKVRAAKKAAKAAAKAAKT